MEKVKISLFSKIMAWLSIIFAGGVLCNNLQDFFEWHILPALFFIILIGILVLLSRTPRLLIFKILILILCAFAIWVVQFTFYYIIGFVFYFNFGIEFLGEIVLIIACFAISWTVSIAILNTVNISVKIWLICLLLLFVITAIISLFIFEVPASIGDSRHAFHPFINHMAIPIVAAMHNV
jgi:hypothetical protein